jgi:2-keto-4-pentenoate hydratase/2-oxohepta-3-ene-1,7-dioic acid hydratase in catechol pathway
MRRSAIVTLTVVIGAVSFAAAATRAESKQVATYVRFQVGDRVSYGIVDGDQVRQINGDLFGSWKPGEKTYPLSEVKVLAPTTPSKVLALAGNYVSHLGATTTHENPEVFFKPPSCLIAPGEDIVIPRATDNVHYEAEMVIVIGKRAKNVSVGEAKDYVLGVTCGNDVSARDWQKGDVQWWRAKGTDTFGPCGPFIVSGLDYDNLLLQLRVNGEVKQEQRTSDLVHGVAETVSWASQHVTLEPGDLIFTGTPGTTEALKPGDVVEVDLEGVGVLRNGVVKAR